MMEKSDNDAATLLYLAHDKGTFDRRQALYLAQFVEDEFLVLFHIARAYL